MVRPHASEGSKHLAVLFAKTVTTEVLHVAPASASVGRSGQYSVFDALSICFPQAARGPSRNGVSLVELNKSLEKEGFVRVRFRNPRKARRKKDDAERASRKWRDPENQSFYRYGCRRWRDPEDPADFEFLSSVWPQVNEIAPVPCPLAEILQYLRAAIAADMDSEVIQRKLVSSVAASQATTPSCGSPVSVTSPPQWDESFGESEGSEETVCAEDECWDEVFGKEAATPSTAASAFDSSAHDMFPTVHNVFFERVASMGFQRCTSFGLQRCPSGPDFHTFAIGSAEGGDVPTDGLMAAFATSAPAGGAAW
mmetsp:Transcript_20435/g.41390  ORF Transcript_20435/g.41390 Transcript_20435/m.41390 type:complete len:311 (+) Transcript_20435:129-1061(+)